MTFAAPRRLGFLALVLGILPALAHAQTSPSSASGRTWTDPPARGSAEAETAATKIPAAKPVAAAEAPRQTAAVRRSTQGAVRAPKNAHGISEARARVARPVASPSRRPVVRTVARLHEHPDLAVRRVTTRPPMVRYSYGIGPESSGPFVEEDDRARRIRQAQEAGYLVVRSRSIEFPDGRRLRTYRPYEEDSDD